MKVANCQDSRHEAHGGKYLSTGWFKFFSWIHFQQFLRQIKHFIWKHNKSIDIINIKEAFKKELMNKSMKAIDNDSENKLWMEMTVIFLFSNVN